jgi:hypothetical protein
MQHQKGEPMSKKAELAAEVEAEKKQRVKDCQEAIAEVLDTFQCDLLPVHTFEGNQCRTGITINPR